MVPLVEKKSPANIPYSLILKQIGICYIKGTEFTELHREKFV